MKPRRPLEVPDSRPMPSNGGTAEVLDGAEAGLDRRQLLEALQRVRRGDFSMRLPGSLTKIDGKIADTFNEIVAANEKMDQEL
jgi:hypothetical protein